LLKSKAPNKEDYLWYGRFSNKKKLYKQFEVILSSRMKGRYKNVTSKL